MSEHNEFYRKYRPKTLKSIVGQGGAVKAIHKMVETKSIPHAFLFVGPSGVGKTTLARILCKILECHANDIKEINAASTKGIEMVREVESAMRYAPAGGKARAWIIDEAGQLTAQAQDCFLKILEDPPRKCYFFLATTDPHKVKETIKTRCTTISLNTINKVDIKELVERVCAREEITLSSQVMEKLVEYSEGSARRALVLLETIHGLDEQDQLKAIMSSGHSEKAIELCWMFLRATPWSKMSQFLGELEDEVESVRRLILSVYGGMLISGKYDNNPKMQSLITRVIDIFQFNTYDSGKAGFYLMCYTALLGRTK